MAAEVDEHQDGAAGSRYAASRWLVTSRAQHLLGPTLDDVVECALMHPLGLHVSLADYAPERRARLDAGGLHPGAHRLERRALLDGQFLAVEWGFKGGTTALP